MAIRPSGREEMIAANRARARARGNQNRVSPSKVQNKTFISSNLVCTYLHMSRERVCGGILGFRECALGFSGFWKCGERGSGLESRFPDPGPRIPALWVPDPGYSGSSWLDMASCWLQDGLETPKMTSRGLQDASKMPREGLKMT